MANGVILLVLELPLIGISVLNWHYQRVLQELHAKAPHAWLFARMVKWQLERDELNVDGPEKKAFSGKQ